MHELSAEVTLTVPFHDADPMGVCWHGNYFRYFELARTALLDKIDYNPREMADSGYAWPIIDTRVKYVKTLEFDRRIRVTARLTEYEHRLRIDYLILDAKTGERLTRAHTLQVAVELASGEMCFASPRVLLDKLEAFECVD